MAHYGLLGIGIIFIIIGIILFIIGWILASRVNPALNNNLAVAQPTTTTGEWFLIIGGVILFIIGLIMVMLSFYWKPAVVVPLPQPVPPILPPAQHPINVYVPPQVQAHPQETHYEVHSPPPQYIDMPPQIIHVNQAPPNVVFDQPLPVAPPVSPPVRISYGRAQPPSVTRTSVQQVSPTRYDPNPVTSTTYRQPPPQMAQKYIPGYGPTTGVRTPGLQAVTTTSDLPNRPEYEYDYPR